MPKESSRGQPRRVVTVHVRAPSVAQRTRVPFLQVEASGLCHPFYYGPTERTSSGSPQQSSQSPRVGSAYAGYGPGVFVTIAGSAQQLSGPFAVLNIDLGIGLGKASLQVSADNNGMGSHDQWGAGAGFRRFGS